MLSIGDHLDADEAEELCLRVRCESLENKTRSFEDASPRIFGATDMTQYFDPHLRRTSFHGDVVVMVDVRDQALTRSRDPRLNECTPGSTPFS
jgi:hypothetical protein